MPVNSLQVSVPLPQAADEPQVVLHRVHTVQGRSRFYVEALLHEPGTCARVERSIESKPHMLRVTARPKTGSLILEYPPAYVLDDEKLRAWLVEALSQPEAPQKPASDPLQSLHRSQHLSWCTRPTRCILEELQTDELRGLDSRSIAQRRLQFGSNELDQVQASSHWKLFTRQFGNSQTALLVGSAGLSLLTGGMLDLVMIGGVILLNGYIAYRSEAHADAVICSIGKIEPQEVRVLRDGRYAAVLDHELVVGDIIVLAPGVVPADLRLLNSKGLMVDESPLTGESMPVAKSHESIHPEHIHTLADCRNLLFRGTIITSGQGLAVVIGTGDNTEIGRVRSLVATAQPLESPLQKDLQSIGRQTIQFSGAICGAVFFIGLLRGKGLVQMLQTSVSLAVAAVPEGLPTIGTTTMALGVAKLKKQNIFVRRLNVLEALGSVEVLCLDKTGTLTMNEMIAEGGYFGRDYWHVSQARDLLQGKASGPMSATVPLRKWGMIAALCSDCEQVPEPDGGVRWSSSSTEKAIILLAERMGFDVKAIQSQHPRFKVSYRTESRQFMVTYHRTKDSKRQIAAVKGSPEQLLEMCGWILDQGLVREINDEIRQQLRAQNKELARQGLRVLGFAFLEGEDLDSIQDRKLIWLAAVGMEDPTREGMSDLIKKFHQAGIKTIMMTGDQHDTAKAVGKALGFNGGNKVKTLDARHLKGLSLEEIGELAEDTQVFSRVSPSDKLRIVHALQKRGRIVAMTGDGINDSPALKAAHIGIAMGYNGTSAARESADIVLKDDNLQVLFDAIAQGRTVRTNLRKSIQYLLGTNLSEILVMFLAIAAGRDSPLNSVQLLWINLLTDVLPGLALALDPPTEDTMQQGPADPNASILSRDAKVKLFEEAGLIAAGSLLSFERVRASGSATESTTAAFLSLTTSQILHTFSASADPKGLVRGQFPGNKLLYAAVGFAGSTVALGCLSAPFRRILGNAPLRGSQLSASLLHGVWPVLAIELLKTLRLPTVEPEA